jgi:hypothetical protein
MKGPTARQEAALAWIRDRIRRRGDAPSSSELARHLGIEASTARRLLSGMERVGLLRLVPAGAGRMAVSVSRNPPRAAPGRGASSARSEEDSTLRSRSKTTSDEAMRSASCPARRVVGIGAGRCSDSGYGVARAGADNEAARDFCSRSVAVSLERMARGIVLLAFRNGPIEDLHAGVPCACCDGLPGISRITDAEMKLIMTTAVDRVYTLLALEALDPGKLDGMLAFADLSTKSWDRPELTRDF